MALQFSMSKGRLQLCPPVFSILCCCLLRKFIRVRSYAAHHYLGLPNILVPYCCFFKKLPKYFIRPQPGYISSPSQPPDTDEFHHISFTMNLFDLCVGALPPFLVCVFPSYCSDVKILLRIHLSK